MRDVQNLLIRAEHQRESTSWLPEAVIMTHIDTGFGINKTRASITTEIQGWSQKQIHLISSHGIQLWHVLHTILFLDQHLFQSCRILLHLQQDANCSGNKWQSLLTIEYLNSPLILVYNTRITALDWRSRSDWLCYHAHATLAHTWWVDSKTYYYSYQSILNSNPNPWPWLSVPGKINGQLVQKIRVETNGRTDGCYALLYFPC